MNPILNIPIPAAIIPQTIASVDAISAFVYALPMECCTWLITFATSKDMTATG